MYMWGTIFWVYYSLRTYIYLHGRNYFLSVLFSEDIDIFTCEKLFSECTTLWGHTYIYMGRTIFWMYYSLRTYIYLHERNYFLSVLLFEDIHIFTWEELFSELTTLWGHTYIYMWGTIVGVDYSLRTYIYLHVRNYFLNVLLSEDIHIFICDELLSECTTFWGHAYIYMWGTIVWVHCSLRTYIYLQGRNYFLNVILSEDIQLSICEELLSECTTLWGDAYIYIRGTIFWMYFSLRTYIYLYVRNYCLSALLSEDIHIFIWEEIFAECTTLWGHPYIYMWKTIFRVYYSLRTYIYLHVRNYFLNVLLSEDIHISICEELLSECTTLWGDTYIYIRGTIFWMYYSLRTYIYLNVRNYCLSALLSEDIYIFTCEELFAECTTLWWHPYIYMWKTIFRVYYSLRTYIYLHVKNYFLNVLLSEDIHISICEELLSECTTLWGDTHIYIRGTIFWMYYSLRTYIYLHVRNYCLSALLSEDIHIFTWEELFAECTTLWGHPYIYMWKTIFRVYYSLRTYIYLNVRNYLLNVLLSEDIDIFTCEKLFSECITLWGHRYIYMWETIFWVYYSLRTYIYLHGKNYILNVLLSEDIHICTCEELFSECTTLWGHTYIYMGGTIFWVYYSLRT
jgi:hypothetical protein